MRAHPDKAERDEVFQQKAKESSQHINIARDHLKNGLENHDGLGTFPVDVNESNSEDWDQNNSFFYFYILIVQIYTKFWDPNQCILS